MRYVSIEQTGDGYSIDASAYGEQLPVLAESLPAGARSFVSEQGHYDFNSQRFIKNLRPQRLLSGETDGERWL